jgi:5-methyltetrahydrofolate--homocysteine methyltransferase
MKLDEFLTTTSGLILLDGGMGTELAKAGLEMGGQNSLTHPEAVSEVHRQYVDCGIHLLLTNTLTMNRAYIESHHVEVDVRQVNLAGARLARAAVREGQYVLGNLTSTGRMLQPLGDLSEAEAYDAYHEQASILAEGGVDGLIIETMFDLREALCALRACKKAADLPILVSMAFSTPARGGRTIMGNSARDCAAALADAGATVVGSNCGDLDPLQQAEIVAAMHAACSLPILVEPNAGKPHLLAGETHFEMTPEDFVTGMQRCIDAGARLVGGCCGTSPAHIRLLAEQMHS